jgi:accessory colonization factor AcfC
MLNNLSLEEEIAKETADIDLSSFSEEHIRYAENHCNQFGLNKNLIPLFLKLWLVVSNGDLDSHIKQMNKIKKEEIVKDIIQ